MALGGRATAHVVRQARRTVQRQLRGQRATRERQLKGFVTGDGVRDGRRPLGAVLARQILFALHLDEPAGGALKLEGDAVATIQLDRRCGG